MALNVTSSIVTKSEENSSESEALENQNLSEWEVLENFVKSLVEDWRYQARVGPATYSLLVLLYAAMILVGATGNILVILVVIRNRAMRTARNVFIVNLAVSDLMLCLITMPLTLVEILYMTWQFGDYPAACPVAALLQATSIFVSTLSITAIALDRRQLIVCPHEAPPGIRLILSLVPLIWFCALFLASPLAIWKKLENWTEWADAMNIIGANSSADAQDYNCSVILNDPPDPETEDVRLNCLLKEILPRWLNELQSCKEDFPRHGRLIYSSITMVIQYLLPTITISVAYYQIYGQLKIRLDQKMNQLAANTAGSGTNVIERIENDISRMRRTIHLLISVGLVFCICWLPLNILNTTLDLTEKSRTEKKENGGGGLTNEQLCIIYAVCHVTGMMSACANPVIYGYLNENFHREFKDIFDKLRSHLGKCLFSWHKSSGNPAEQEIQMDNGRDHQSVELLNGNDPPDLVEQNPEVNRTKIVGQKYSSPKNVDEKIVNL